MRILPIMLLLTFFSGRLAAQLSPGELSNAHKDLEGISNCTKCHDLGSKVSNTKCLECHKEIKSRIDRNEGFHVSWEVKGKDCATCHSDHHGRKFDMIRFDENTFISVSIKPAAGHIDGGVDRCSYYPCFHQRPNFCRQKRA